MSIEMIKCLVCNEIIDNSKGDSIEVLTELCSEKCYEIYTSEDYIEKHAK